jgi:hypothetical protein
VKTAVELISVPSVKFSHVHVDIVGRYQCQQKDLDTC